MIFFRAKISIQKNSTHPLNYEYQYYLAGMLFKKLGDVNFELASELHSHQNFKFYTFSNLIINRERKKTNNENGLQFKNAHFYLSSPDFKFIKSFTEGLLINPEFNLGNCFFNVNKIEILPKIEINEKSEFITLSPIYLKTIRLINGERKEWDLYPKDGKFYENIHNNLLKRYEAFYGHTPEKDYFEIIKIFDVKPKRVKISNSFRRCSLFKFKVTGSKELLRFGYDAGFGEKNAMGFGCCEIVKK